MTEQIPSGTYKAKLTKMEVKDGKLIISYSVLTPDGWKDVTFVCKFLSKENKHD